MNMSYNKHSDTNTLTFNFTIPLPKTNKKKKSTRRKRQTIFKNIFVLIDIAVRTFRATKTPKKIDAAAALKKKKKRLYL